MRAAFERLLGPLALVLVLASLWQLEGVRRGVDITHASIGPTPVISYAQPDAEGPVVVIAHGFAGSATMMQAYALTLARAGYRVHSFDFQGHGRNPVPMSGDVTSVLGTTQLLVDQTLKVVDAVRDDAPVALLGHSMATDVLIRAALQRPDDIGPLVLLSAFSQAVTATEPRDMLLIAGAGEPHLREFGVEAVQMVEADAAEGDVVGDGDMRRLAIAAPLTEHVSILHSRAGQFMARGWLDASFRRMPSGDVPPASGWWLMGLLAGIVALARPLSRILPARASAIAPLEGRAFWLVALLPAVVVPVVATAVSFEVLPVMVADYLALHLLLMGVAQLLILWRAGVRPAGLSALGIVALVVWGLGAFGLALDRYGANFVPMPERWWIIAALCLGTLPFMLADALATQGGAAPRWRRWVLRVSFFASLGWAVFLDFEGLFFLILIAPVMVLFYVVYGLMGRWVAARCGPATSGVALGLILAYALGVSFPLFAAGG